MDISVIHRHRQQGGSIVFLATVSKQQTTRHLFRDRIDDQVGNRYNSSGDKKKPSRDLAVALTSGEAFPRETLRLSGGGDPASDPDALSEPDSETDRLFLLKEK